MNMIKGTVVRKEPTFNKGKTIDIIIRKQRRFGTFLIRTGKIFITKFMYSARNVAP